MPLSPLQKTPKLRWARSGMLLVVYYAEEADPATLDLLGQAVRNVITFERRVALLSLLPIHTSTFKVSDEVKRKSVELIRGLNKDLVGSATVVLGKGIGATIVRTFLTGFNLLTKSPAPQKAFSTIEESLAWFATLPAAPDAKGLDAPSIARHFQLDEAGKKAA